MHEKAHDGSGAFPQHTLLTAPVPSRGMMGESEEIFGFVPQLHRILAESPLAYRCYLDLFNRFSNSSLSPVEQQVVMLAGSVENLCHYCTAGHSFLLERMAAPQELIDKIRDDEPLLDPRLEALRSFVKDLVGHRGHVPALTVRRYFSVGFTHGQALDILVGLAAKLISNYTNSLAQTPLDELVVRHAWVHPSDR